MPPQVKISKEQIKNTAFEMTCENGFESVTARKLAERLNCSTQPIFRVYENMDALKRDLYELGTEYARSKMLGMATNAKEAMDAALKNTKAAQQALSEAASGAKTSVRAKKSQKGKGSDITYLSVGMAYIKLAKDEAHLFRLIGAVDDLGIEGDGNFLLKGEAERLEGFIPGAEGLSDEKKKGLLTTIWALIHGIATLVVSGRIDLSDDEMRGYITKAYEGLLHELKGK